MVGRIKKIDEGIVESISRKKLEECIEDTYRNRIFKNGYVFVHGIIEMVRSGRVPEEIVEELNENPNYGVEVRDVKTVYNYINRILEMYSEIREEFYLKLKERIEEAERKGGPNRKFSYWKGRFLEDIVYTELVNLTETLRNSGIDIFVIPIYKVRTRPRIHEKGRKSDADKIADILVIDFSRNTLIVMELKNFWNYYSGHYPVEEQASKLVKTLSKEGLGIILDKIENGIIPGAKERVYSPDMIRVTWDVLCGSGEDWETLLTLMNVGSLTMPQGFRKVYIWFHAGEQVDKLEERLDEFEKRNGVRILRVFIDKPIYYTPEDKRLMRGVLKKVLDIVYSNEEWKIKTIEVESKEEKILIIGRDPNIIQIENLNAMNLRETD